MTKRKSIWGSVVLLSVPLFLLIPAYPVIAVKLFQWREPLYQVPLSIASPLQVRKDPYGSGLFGAPRSGGRKHQGMDLVAPVGTQVLAAKSGKVFIGHIRNGMGRYVEICHPDGSVTRYGHLKRIAIRDGQRVRRGQPLGTVGKTGNARRRIIQPHLHFEVWNEQGIPVAPLSVMETVSD